MDSRELYLVLLVAVVCERLVELVLTARNARRLEARGGYEVGRGHFPVMAILHTGLLVAAPLEVWWLDRPFAPALGFTMLAVVAFTMALRYWAVITLGDRWTARVFVVPGESPVTGGPYRFLRHPNYLAVILEVAALPLVHGAWITALVASVGNAWVLKTRIRVEEEALADSSNYNEAFGEHPRLVPGNLGDPPRS